MEESGNASTLETGVNIETVDVPIGLKLDESNGVEAYSGDEEFFAANRERHASTFTRETGDQAASCSGV